MNKSESKYYATACLMDEALVALLGEKDFEYITVKEICEKAGVHRSTFYLHYETLGDLLEETSQYVSRGFFDYMAEELGTGTIGVIAEAPLEKLFLITPRYLMPYLHYVEKRKKVFGALIKNAGLLRFERTYEFLFRDIINPILDRFSLPEDEKSYLMAFYMNGLTAVVSRWLERDCAETPQAIAAVLERCIRPSAELGLNTETEQGAEADKDCKRG